MNTIPIEILEKIIIESIDTIWSWENYSWTYEKVILKDYALVNRTWALIANSLIWREVNLSGYLGSSDKGNEFPFYRHITKPGYVCGKYIQKLTLEFSKLWPICIIKILQACPNIIDLTIGSYAYYDHRGRGKVNNFLKEIQVLTPKLKRLNLEFSHNIITGIEKLIEDRKDLQIIATRKSKINRGICEKYNGKKWGS